MLKWTKSTSSTSKISTASSSSTTKRLSSSTAKAISLVSTISSTKSSAPTTTRTTTKTSTSTTTLTTTRYNSINKQDMIYTLFSIGNYYLLTYENPIENNLWDLNTGVLVYKLKSNINSISGYYVNNNFNFIYPTKTTSKVQTTTKPTSTTKQEPINVTYGIITAFDE